MSPSENSLKNTLNTATQTDDKTHTERTAAAARILVVRSGLQRDTLLA